MIGNRGGVNLVYRWKGGYHLQGKVGAGYGFWTDMYVDPCIEGVSYLNRQIWLSRAKTALRYWIRLLVFTDFSLVMFVTLGSPNKLVIG